MKKQQFTKKKRFYRKQSMQNISGGGSRWESGGKVAVHVCTYGQQQGHYYSTLYFILYTCALYAELFPAPLRTTLFLRTVRSRTVL